ncbi:MAG: hypothetical protein A3C74_03740 [Candidatus Magasanikbacteria bacterium RIFCSPHIGHO2_02_FULL_44_13]|nr:MAG: hypothetical protein A3C74_03740 [Candidatus Magasanikbacteria bacterium RIFCSPHIGHO2_02_FULL_44_13]
MAGGFKLIKTMISLIVRYGSILTEKNHLVNQKWEGRPLMRPAQSSFGVVGATPDPLCSTCEGWL